jgi:WhiB family redox-sensing transcriptional regulator
MRHCPICWTRVQRTMHDCIEGHWDTVLSPCVGSGEPVCNHASRTEAEEGGMTNRDWMIDAKCRDHDPEMFFPNSTGNGTRQAVARAAVICRECPVIFECRSYGRNEVHGVWGGEGRSGYPVTSGRPLAPHGTEAAARRHQRAGEKPCHQCREAAAWAQRQRRP